MSPPKDASMRRALAALRGGQDLSRAQMQAVFGEVMRGDCDDAQLGALLLGLAQKGETMDEIVGAAAAMRSAVTPVESSRAPLLDTCGTGGSGIARRNVSTAVAIVVASCGVAVAKHGNRAATSRSGSADVLEALGLAIDATPARVARCIDEVGIGFLFAAALHPAMKHAMGPRRSIGVRTIFNLLGPLTNPAGATRQLLGVYDPARCEAMAGALGALGSERVFVVHGFAQGVAAGPGAPPGIDDLSGEGETLVAQWHRGRVRRTVLRAADAEIAPFSWAETAGGSPKENAAALRALLGGAPGPYRRAVAYSGATALLAASDEGWAELPAMARRIEDAIDTGGALRTFERLVACSHGRPAGPPNADVA